MPEKIGISKSLLRAAEAGDCEAQSFLAMIYLEGWEGDEKDIKKRDIKKSVEWETKAAEQGYVDAQFHLAEIYANEEDVKDINKANYWYEKASAQGHEEAKSKLSETEQVKAEHIKGSSEFHPEKQSIRWVKIGCIVLLVMVIGGFLLYYYDTAIEVVRSVGIFLSICLGLLVLRFVSNSKVSSSSSLRSTSNRRPTATSKKPASTGKMPNNKPSSWKNCVTCDYWTGPRKVSTFRDRVEYFSNQDKGECVGGGWNKAQKTAMSSCNKWEKWGRLK